MQLNEIIENNTLEQISKRTRLAPDVLEKLFSGDFKSFTKVQALGFVSIVEREYRADLSDLRRQCKEFFADGNDVSEQPIAGDNPPKKPIITNLTPTPNRKKYIKPVLFVAVSLGILYGAWQSYMTIKGADSDSGVDLTNSQTEATPVKDETVSNENKKDDTQAKPKLVVVDNNQKQDQKEQQADKKENTSSTLDEIAQTDQALASALDEDTPPEGGEIEVPSLSKMVEEKRAKEEAARKAKLEAEKKAKEEAKRRAAEERIAKEKALKEAEAKKIAEKKAKLEAEKKAKAEAAAKAKLEAEKKAKEEAKRKAAELAKKNELAKKLAAQKAAKAKAEAARKAKLAAQKKAKELAKKKAAQEARKKALAKKKAAELAKKKALAKKLAAQKAAKAKAKSSKEAKQKAIKSAKYTITPHKNMWMGIVDLKTMKRRTYTGKGVAVFNKPDGRWIVATNHGHFSFRAGSRLFRFNDNRKHYLIIQKGNIHEIPHATFQKLNQSKAW